MSTFFAARLIIVNVENYFVRIYQNISITTSRNTFSIVLRAATTLSKAEKKAIWKVFCPRRKRKENFNLEKCVANGREPKSSFEKLPNFFANNLTLCGLSQQFQLRALSS